jgi:hypothetical protein
MRRSREGGVGSLQPCAGTDPWSAVFPPTGFGIGGYPPSRWAPARQNPRFTARVPGEDRVKRCTKKGASPGAARAWFWGFDPSGGTDLCPRGVRLVVTEGGRGDAERRREWCAGTRQRRPRERRR